jgi:site-specific DNA-methyltransferase (adenine-specific)
MVSQAENLDCLDYTARFPDGFFELAIVDPPYGINLVGKNPCKNKSDGDKVFNTSWDDRPPGKEYFDELMRVSREQIIWGGNYFLDILGYCKAPIIWDKLNGDSLYADGEFAWTSSGLPRNLKIFRHQWCGAFKDSERQEKKIHPTQKPAALYKWILSRYAKPGFKILDTHLGGGASRVAAWDLGFDFYSCELSPEYYQAQELRFQAHKSQGELFAPDESRVLLSL